MSENYLSLVNEEFDSLGLEKIPARASWPPHEWTYRDLEWLVSRTFSYNDILAKTTGEMPEATTYPARQAAKILNNGPKPDEVRYHLCCFSAEYNLLANLRSEAVTNAHSISPLILTKGDEAVGIIKGCGENSFYGLVDDPVYGIVRSAFATPRNRHNVRQMIAADHAWRAPIESLGSVIPLRLSLFTVPPEERAGLSERAKDDNRQQCLSTSHEHIVQMAERLLSNSVEVEALYV